ncbi:MAG: NAD(P)-dependent oxidoreductase [Bacteroidota bacterium]
MSGTSQTVLLSGATGFLGASLAKDLALNGFKVVALTRNSSSLKRFDDFKSDNIVFVNTDEPGYKEHLVELQPASFIHSAWSGVSAKGRDDWEAQAENIKFSTGLLLLSAELKIKKIIGLGSQAEYGNFHGRINEETQAVPVSAYGAAKLATFQMLRSFCEQHGMEWYWLRLFSTYGKREDSTWLIPSVISNAINNKPMDLTGCEQRYDYLFTKDLATAIIAVLNSTGASGLYNLSSNTSIRLKDLISKIGELVNPAAKFNFGALPYRPNQVMHMEGDSTKFNTRFSFRTNTTMDANLEEIVNDYKKVNKK